MKSFLTQLCNILTNSYAFVFKYIEIESYNLVILTGNFFSPTFSHQIWNIGLVDLQKKQYI